MTDALEVNFDGIIGPTHNYSGLSHGNRASTTHRSQISNPRDAALEGLEKMRFLHSLGIPQAVLPPQERPHLPTLRRLGFSGSEAEILSAAARTPLLANCSSASAMWTANAATVAPSADTADGRVHFTPANLVNKFHRSLESGQTGRVLRRIFADETLFAHHDPLPSHDGLGDEGAANHTRLCARHGGPGLHLFVYGRSFWEPSPGPKKFPARQTREASAGIARLHGLAEGSFLLAQQNPAVIDRGVFHNDVICVGNGSLLFCHETAFLKDTTVRAELKGKFRRRTGKDLQILRVKKSAVSVEAAVRSYLFNSQLITLPSGELALIAPSECREHRQVRAYLDRLVQDPSQPIRQVHTLQVRQSMRNGGGPACLRLRVVLTARERKAALAGVFFSDGLHERLRDWILRHYRDRLSPKDLADPQLLEETRSALAELTSLLNLGAIYEFQGDR